MFKFFRKKEKIAPPIEDVKMTVAGEMLEHALLRHNFSVTYQSGTGWFFPNDRLPAVRATWTEKQKTLSISIKPTVNRVLNLSFQEINLEHAFSQFIDVAFYPMLECFWNQIYPGYCTNKVILLGDHQYTIISAQDISNIQLQQLNQRTLNSNFHLVTQFDSNSFSYDSISWLRKSSSLLFFLKKQGTNRDFSPQATEMDFVGGGHQINLQALPTIQINAIDHDDWLGKLPIWYNFKPSEEYPCKYPALKTANS